MNEAAREGARDGIGLGEATGRALVAKKPEHDQYSLLCGAYAAGVPFTAHVTIGADIAHFIPPQMAPPWGPQLIRTFVFWLR